MTFIKLLKTIFRASYRFTGPQKEKLLLYDCVSLNLYKKIFKFNCQIFYNRGERIYLNLIHKTFFLAVKKKIRFLDAYKVVFFEKVSPKVILTFNDINFSFFKINSLYKKAKLISVQNSYRSNETGELLKKKKNLFANDIFVFSKAVKNLYKKSINGNIVELGSPISNSINILKRKKSKKIIFISQYSIREPNQKFYYNGLYKDYLDNYKNVDGKAANFINNILDESDYKFYILGRYSRDNKKKEIDFFSSVIDKKFNFIENLNVNNTYRSLESSELVIFVDSTLGYEAIGRGNKVVSLSIRSEYHKWKEAKFGWPLVFKKEKGKFWTNYYDEKLIKNLIFENIKISRNKWFKENNKIISKLMVYNKNNGPLVRTVKKYLE
jgi:surface carbohydrate biosynthesis protein